MNLAKMNFASLLALIFAGQVHLQSVDIHPKWATGIIGGEVQINCEVELGGEEEVTWEFNDVYVYRQKGGSEEYPVGTSKFLVRRSGLEFTLMVRDLRLEDGGKYMCISLTSVATAFLVVLDTPSINLDPPALIEGNTTMVTCEARFGGPKKESFSPDHYPNLKMYLNGSSPNEVIADANAADYVEDYYIISITKNLTVLASMNKRHIVCEIGTAEPFVKTSGAALLNVLFDPSKSGNDIWIVVIAVVSIVILFLVIIAAVTLICRKKKQMMHWQRFQRSRAKENANNTDRNTVEAESLLSNIQQRKVDAGTSQYPITQNIAQGRDGSGAWEHSIAVRFQEQQSDLTTFSQPTIQQEKDVPGASEHSIQPNIQQENDGSGGSELSIEPTIQQGKDGSEASEHSIEPNIQQGNDSYVAAEHSIEENLQDLQSDETESLPLVETPKAPELGSFGCIQLLNSVQNKEELDQHGKEILIILQEDRNSILENDPNILIGLIQKADKLIDSEYYEDIIKVVPHGSEDSPLKYLLWLFNDDECFEKLLENQNKLWSVMKEITKYGDVQYSGQKNY